MWHFQRLPQSLMQSPFFSPNFLLAFFFKKTQIILSPCHISERYLLWSDYLNKTEPFYSLTAQLVQPKTRFCCSVGVSALCPRTRCFHQRCTQGGNGSRRRCWPRAAPHSTPGPARCGGARALSGANTTLPFVMSQNPTPPIM